MAQMPFQHPEYPVRLLHAYLKTDISLSMGHTSIPIHGHFLQTKLQLVHFLHPKNYKRVQETQPILPPEWSRMEKGSNNQYISVSCHPSNLIYQCFLPSVKFDTSVFPVISEF